MKCYKIESYGLKVEATNINDIPKRVGYRSLKEMREDIGEDDLGITVISKEEYDRKDDGLERY